MKQLFSVLVLVLMTQSVDASPGNRRRRRAPVGGPQSPQSHPTENGSTRVTKFDDGTYVIEINNIELDENGRYLRTVELFEIHYVPNAAGGYDIVNDGQAAGTSPTPPTNQQDMRTQNQMLAAERQLLEAMAKRNQVTPQAPTDANAHGLSQRERDRLAVAHPIATAPIAPSVVQDYLDRTGLDPDILRDYLQGDQSPEDTVYPEIARFYDLLDALSVMRSSGYADEARRIMEDILRTVHPGPN